MTKSLIQSVCVFCGSGNGSDPIFLQSAETLGRLMAESASAWFMAAAPLV